MSARDVLVVGNLRGASRSALTTAVSSLKLQVTEIANVEDATAAMEQRAWCAVLIDTTLSGASRFCTEARSHRSLFGIPFIALSPRLTDLAFLNALRWGADDVVALGATEALSVRLGALIGSPPETDAAPVRGDAVVADPERRRGNGLGRAIHTAGYAVRYATDTTSARFYATKPEVDLFILNAELADPKTFIEEAQRGGCKARWVVLTKASHTDELQQAMSAFKGVVVMSSGGPPENILFAVNLLYPSEASRRGEIRALFGTVVFFRAVGDYRDECGFSYTASPQGLYVRTLAPPPADKVWVELIPPDGERRVRLVGKVAWSRSYGRRSGEAAPPGFGVRVADGLGEDLALWSECLNGLEFKAPATLVPEARFSLPAQTRLSEISTPTLSASSARITSLRSTAEQGDSPAEPQGNSAADGGANEPDSLRVTAVPSVPKPPASTSMDRLSAAAKARISTRPSLRLSVPGPVGLLRDPLSKPARLGRPPLEEKPPALAADPAPLPKRVGQGRTVMGLGILQRDGSLTGGTPGSDSNPSDANKGSPVEVGSAEAAPAPIDSSPIATTEASGADARLAGLRLSPVTGRTLSYGSEPPRTSDNKFQAAADALPSSPEDISERPTLSDRFSLERAEQIASQSLSPGAPDALDSLPPDALESDAPSAVSNAAPALRRQLASQPLLDEVPGAPALAETDRNWVGLDSIPPQHRLSDSPPAPAAASPSRKASESDLGATLPGVVVDTVVSPVAPSAEESSPTAEVEPRARYAAEADPVQDPAPAHEVGRYTGPAPAAETVRASAPKRRAIVPVLFAAAVAGAVIALMVRMNAPPSHELIDAPPVPAASAPAPDTRRALPAEPRPADDAVSVPDVPVTGGQGAPPKGLTPTKPPIAATAATARPAPAAAPEAPTADPSAAESASLPTQPQAAVADTNPPRDPSTLSSKSAWLYVQSSVSAHVFVHGVDAGLTNTWLETACGTRFVRLGRSAGDWLSPGVPTIIRCRSANTVEVPVP